MKNNLILKLYSCCLLVAVLTGCSKERLSPSGNQTSEIRNPGQFKSINVAGASAVFVSYGENFKVELKGSDNLIAKFVSKVEGEELILKYKDVNVNDDDLNIYITLPVLTGVTTNGSASYLISGNFPVHGDFGAYIHGSANININGTLSVAALAVEITGSGNASLEKVNAENADFKISGSGNITTTVSNKLKAKIAGSGNVYYYGSPALTTSYSGSGRVIKR